MSDLVAIIPARGGSKGVPHKNKRRIQGRPLFQYSTDFALGSGLFDKVILSTDDDEILAIGVSSVPRLLQPIPQRKPM